MNGSIEIRRAEEGDAGLIGRLLRELAEYERLADKFFLTEDRIQRDFIAETRALFCELAFAKGEPAGLATWYWTYSSFRGQRGIYLEDLYVRQQWRGRKFGKALMRHLVGQARAAGGSYVAWAVLDWNRDSIGFYESLGAKPIRGWIGYRLEGAEFEAVSEK